MNVLCTICARAGSKGVKSKNIRNFNGYPLVYYTLSAYQQFCKRYGKLYGTIDLAVNTDSPELVTQCQGTSIPFIHIERKEELGGDRVAKADVICDTLIQMEEKTGKIYDIILDLDLTSPLRTIEDIHGCLQALVKAENANVAYTITGARRLPFFNMVKENKDGYLETVIQSNYVTRQEAPVCFDMNASIYAYRRIPLLNTKEQDVFTGNTVGWMMKDTAVLDIDSEEDFELLSIIAKYFFKEYPEFGTISENINGIMR